jgi:hypothetical protein
MPTRDDSERTVEILIENYPKTFFADPRQRRPLKPNIHADILEDIAKDPDSELKYEDVQAAVAWYKSHYGYYKACAITGASCYDLKGNVVGKVTAAGAYDAKQQIAAINEAKNLNRERHNTYNVPPPPSAPPPRVLQQPAPPPLPSSSPPPPPSRVLHVPPSPSPLAPEPVAKKRGRPLGSKNKTLPIGPVLTLDPSSKRQHGTISLYSSGCRCEECREAMRQYQQERKKPTLKSPPLAPVAPTADATMDIAQLLVSTDTHMKNVMTLIQQDLDPKVRTIVLQPVLDLLISEITLLKSKCCVE